MNPRRLREAALRGGLASLLALGSVPAWSATHALIMWIGEYADPTANLPGIDLDARHARTIALAMGVAPSNITEVKNAQLTVKGIADTLQALVDRIAPDDKVFLYYSGHGSQTNNATGGRKCSEGMLGHDVKLYVDRDLESQLERLGAKASQVIVMNDSCFSGGAAQKSIPSGLVFPKAFPARTGAEPSTRSVGAAAPAAAAAAAALERDCGDAVNKGFITKSLEVVPRQGARLLYIAASADNEVSYATAQGSVATVAWAACIADPAADTDRSGALSGDELRACAQARVDGRPPRERQTITLTGTTSLPLTFQAATTGSTAPAINPPKALEDIRAGGDAAWTVTLTPSKPSLRIGQDFLEFSVQTNREGYLYVLQVGTDGKTYNLLFPNGLDRDNKVAAGTVKLPRPAWQLRSGGPAGTNHLLAIVSSQPRDFGVGMSGSGPFASATTTPQSTKSIVVVATGTQASTGGRYGTSAVVKVAESP